MVLTDDGKKPYPPIRDLEEAHKEVNAKIQAGRELVGDVDRRRLLPWRPRSARGALALKPPFLNGLAACQRNMPLES